MILSRRFTCARLLLLASLLLSCDNSSITEGDSDNGPSIEQFSVVGSRTGSYWATYTELELEGQIKASGLKSMILDLYDGNGDLVTSKLYDSLPNETGGLTFGPSSALRMLVAKDKWCTGKPSLRLTVEDAKGRTTSKTIRLEALQYRGGPLPKIIAFSLVDFNPTQDTWKVGQQLKVRASCESELGLANATLEIRDSIGRTLSYSNRLELSGFSSEISSEANKLLSNTNPGTWRKGRYKAILILNDVLGNSVQDSVMLLVDGQSPPEILEFEAASFDESSTTWSSGVELEFYGKVVDDSGLTQLRIELFDSTGKSTIIKAVPVSGSSVSYGANETTKINITNPGNWVYTGKYKVRLTAIDNQRLTSSKELVFTEIEGNIVVNLSDTTVNLGGSGSAFPSSLDVDRMVGMTASAAMANQAAVDLRFNNTSDSKNEVRAPSADASLTWATKNTTKFHKVAAGSYETATTTAAIQALYVEGSAQSGQLILNTGDELVVKTVEGNYRIIKVNIIANSGKSNVEFSVKGKK